MLKDPYDNILLFRQSVRKSLLYLKHTHLTAYFVCTDVTPSTRRSMAKKQHV